MKETKHREKQIPACNVVGFFFKDICAELIAQPMNVWGLNLNLLSNLIDLSRFSMK